KGSKLRHILSDSVCGQEQDEKTSPNKLFTRKKKMAVKELFYGLKREDETITEEEQRKQALFSCMMNGDMEKFDALLPLIDVNDLKIKPLRSPLSMACQLEEPLFVAKLLKKGADPNLADQINRTPLMECCLRGGSEIVELLLMHNPSPNKNAQDINGNTPLIYACQKGHLATVKLLLSQNSNSVPCNVNIQNKVGKSALFIAIENSHNEVVKYLLEENGTTLLMRACTKGSSDIVNMLLNHKNSPDINRAEVYVCKFINVCKEYIHIF
ncbi:hypothetical protein RFI_06962, partial [Reticulomyxa filosa]